MATVRPASPSRTPLAVLLSANGLSLVGNMLTAVAVPWFVLETTGSASKTGITGAVIVLPTIVAGIFGGALVDRLGFRRMSIVSDLASGATVALIPALHWSLGITFWQLLVLMFLSALLDVPGATARQSMIPDLAATAEVSLERANSAFSSISRAAQLAGPILAGLLIAQIGASAVLWVDAATFAVSALAVAAGVPSIRPDPGGETDGASYLRDIAQGFGLLWRDQVLLMLIVIAALLNVVTNPLAAVVLPVYANAQFGSAANLGMMLASFGGGALTGAVLYGAVGHHLPRRGVFFGGFLGAAVSFGSLATLPGLLLSVIALAFLGIATGPLAPIFITVVQERTPAAMRGRIFGLISASVWVVLPLGMLAAGLLLEHAGLRMTFLIQAGALLILAGIVLLVPALQDMEAVDENQRH